jgi:hypothetical protein
MTRRALNIREDILSTCYKRILSAVTHKLNVFRTQVFMDIFSCFALPTICPHLSVTLSIIQIVERASLNKLTINYSVDINYITQSPFNNKLYVR